MTSERLPHLALLSIKSGLFWEIQFDDMLRLRKQEKSTFDCLLTYCYVYLMSATLSDRVIRKGKQ